MKTLTLIRTLYTDKATFGVLLDEHQNFICHMLELPWKDNQHNISCIPVGMYHCTYLPHTGQFRYAVHNVPGRDLIRIHIANYLHELLGCLAPGFNFAIYVEAGLPMIRLSGRALGAINDYTGDEFMLNITHLNGYPE